MGILSYIFLFSIGIPFAYFNYKIIVSDITYKKIPNIYLGYLLLLLPLWWISLFLINPFQVDINIYLFIGQIILTCLIGFALFYYGVWAAGDAKYFLVLGLFIPHVGITAFIGNLGSLVIIYLLVYFLYFYLGKCLFKRGYFIEMIKNGYQDLKDSFTAKTTNKSGERNLKHTTIVILKWLIVFLIIYISYRLIRMYLINDLLTPGEETGLFKYIFTTFGPENKHFLIFTLIGVYFLIIFVLFIILKNLFGNHIQRYKVYLSKKSGLSEDIIEIIAFLLIFLCLMGYIVYAFIQDPENIKHKLYIIFTISLLIFFIVKILIYSYRLVFQISELTFVPIHNLKQGDIVDKAFLEKIFGTQKALGASGNEDGILSPSPAEFFRNIKNPIDSETKGIIQQCYHITNKYHSDNQTTAFEKIEAIKILKTFAFGGYIFFAFIISFFFGNIIFEHFVKIVLFFIEKLFA